jgi:hypothetical protein
MILSAFVEDCGAFLGEFSTKTKMILNMLFQFNSAIGTEKANKNLSRYSPFKVTKIG